MLSPHDFAGCKEFIIDNFSELVPICEQIRKKDKCSGYIITLPKGEFFGNFKFPFSGFFIRCLNDKATLSSDIYANMKDKEGKELTTWKTATLKITGNSNIFENIEIRNTSSDPFIKGQEIALAIYGTNNLFLNCSFFSTQDTLFVGPLPDDLATRYLDFLSEDERYHEGNTSSYFISCHIAGSIDFIFGAGQASFFKCLIESLNDKRPDYVGYISAPAHSLKDDYGFFFAECSFVSADLEQNSVYLARPWRDYGKAVFASCIYQQHIKSEGFSDWNDLKRYRTARFEEYPLQKGRAGWVKNKAESQLPARYRSVLAELKTIS